jgi:hypothetical protein
MKTRTVIFLLWALTTWLLTAGVVLASAPSDDSPTNSSVAKSNSAMVDMSVVGMELGKPLLLPDCNSILFPGAVNCHVRGWTLDIDRDTGKEKRVRGTIVRLALIEEDRCPSWVRRCEAYLMMLDGILEGVFFYTTGRNVEKSVSEELRAKYGQILFERHGTFTPDVGNAFTFTDLEWFLPGLHIQYDVLRKDENDRAHVDEGIVWIELESVYKLRMADKKKPAKKKL